MNNILTPKLSVLLVTYNHEKYIRQALDSVLMQKTDFDFEIVVSDDFSQDSTPAIVEGYQADYQNIRILSSEKNVGITRNYQRGLAACRGEYIAVLEGDDYWTSPNKLKLSSAFLDEHAECAFCFHRFIKHDESSHRFTIHPAFEIEAEFSLFTAAQLARENFIGNFSACVYRREAVDSLDPALFEMKVYDWMFNITVAQEGMIGYLPIIMSVYRAHPFGAWSAKPPEEWRPELLELIDIYNKYLGFKFDSEFQTLKSILLAEMKPPIDDAATPKVSVLLVTYNQEKYIRQALDSVLMQKADFDFEIIVADDHSDDSTLAIVLEYQACYPNIRILPSEQKIGITRNYQRGFAACRGQYVSILEGDDYWTSPNKLKLSSTFLEEHPECSLCFHRLIRHDEETDKAMVHPVFGAERETILFTASQLARENFIGNFSTCTYRREVIDKLDPGIWQLKVREWLFNIVVAQNGNIGYMPEILSVYRGHSGGIWSMKPEVERRTELLKLIEAYNKHLGFRLNSDFQVFKDRKFPKVTSPAQARDENSPVLPRLRRWVEPFIPPVLVRVASSIYHRARRTG